MHRGELVEQLRLHDLQPGLEQLGSNRQRHGPADDEHREAEPQVQCADFLVIRSPDPAHDALGLIDRPATNGALGFEYCLHAVLLAWNSRQDSGAHRLSRRHLGAAAISLGSPASPSVLPNELRTKVITWAICMSESWPFHAAIVGFFLLPF